MESILLVSLTSIVSFSLGVLVGSRINKLKSLAEKERSDVFFLIIMMVTAQVIYGVWLASQNNQLDKSQDALATETARVDAYVQCTVRYDSRLHDILSTRADAIFLFVEATEKAINSYSTILKTSSKGNTVQRLILASDKYTRTVNQFQDIRNDNGYPSTPIRVCDAP